jgi:hypothetical protein
MDVMDFKSQIELLSSQVTERRQHINNEETTKQALIIPFIHALGYDIFNPLEVCPEYVADFGKKKGEKVDYAVFHNGELVMFIEAKAINENLDKHSAQLARYFNSTPRLKLAILTNGIEYNFFTDIKTINVMDETPFLRMNITTPSDDGLKVLEHIRKKSFNAQKLQELAKDFIYAKDLEVTISNILLEPSNEFIRFIVKDIVDTRITSYVIDAFRPLVKKAIHNVINTYRNEHIHIANDRSAESNRSMHKIVHTRKVTEAAEGNDLDSPISQDAIDIKEDSPELITSVLDDRYLEVYECLIKIFEIEGFDLTRIKYGNTSSYMLLYVNTPEKWIAKIYNQGNGYIITVPFSTDRVKKTIGQIFEYADADTGEATNITVTQPNDIYKMSRLLIKIINDRMI